MSLQARIIGIVSAVLLASIVLGAVLAGLEGRASVANEIRAALHSGIEAVQTAYAEPPPLRTDGGRGLRAIVAGFDGDRHLVAVLQDAAGRPLARSDPETASGRAPSWFERWIAPGIAAALLPAPGAPPGASIRLEPAPEADIGALWRELSALIGVTTAATLACLVLISLTVRAALRPLRQLALGLVEIGRGDLRSRAPERGPSEVRELERSFNATVERLEAVGRRNAELERQLLTIQDEERAEIARDLHDEVGPQLFAVSVDAQLILQHVADGRSGAVQAQVEAIQTGVHHVQREIRALVARLRPARATELGLRRAVEDLAGFWGARRPEIAFALDLHVAEGGMEEGVKDVAYRVVQEAVSNAVRHARPARIAVALRREADTLAVEVVNDGVGLVVERPESSFGLLGMRERVGAAGGAVEAGPIAAPAGRWRVFARLPLGSARARRPAPAEAVA